MKTRILFIILSFSAATAVAQSVDAAYEVGAWKHFASSAVSHTFDDNLTNQLGLMVPMFNDFDYHLTLYAITNANWAPINWNGLKKAAADGHEIASHTVTHPYLNELSLDEQAYEVLSSRDSIQSKIEAGQSLTLAYPYCVAGNDSLVSSNYIAARACQGSINPFTPGDFYNISSILVGSESSVNTASDLNSRVNSAVRPAGWTVFLFHGIDNDGGYSPISSREIKSHLEYLKENEDKFWVDSFVNVVKYIRERNAVSVTELSISDERIDVEVTDTLDNEIFNIPITIQRELPQGWDSAAVQQNSRPVPTFLFNKSGIYYIRFDATPDNGSVILTKETASAVSTEEDPRPDSPALIRNYPNPFNPSTTIAYTIHATGNVSLEVFNSLGKKMTTLVHKVHTPGDYAVQWDASGYVSGMYLYYLKTAETKLTGKMLLAK